MATAVAVRRLLAAVVLRGLKVGRFIPILSRFGQVDSIL